MREVCYQGGFTDSALLVRNRDRMIGSGEPVLPRDVGVVARMLFYLEHAIQDASTTRAGTRRVV